MRSGVRAPSAPPARTKRLEGLYCPFFSHTFAKHPLLPRFCQAFMGFLAKTASLRRSLSHNIRVFPAQRDCLTACTRMPSFQVLPQVPPQLREERWKGYLPDGQVVNDSTTQRLDPWSRPWITGLVVHDKGSRQGGHSTNCRAKLRS